MIWRNKYMQVGLTRDPIARDIFIHLTLPKRRHVSFHLSWINDEIIEQVEREGLRCR